MTKVVLQKTVEIETNDIYCTKKSSPTKILKEKQ